MHSMWRLVWRLLWLTNHVLDKLRYNDDVERVAQEREGVSRGHRGGKSVISRKAQQQRDLSGTEETAELVRMR